MLPVLAMCSSNSTLPGPSAISLPRSTLRRGLNTKPVDFFGTHPLCEMRPVLKSPTLREVMTPVRVASEKKYKLADPALVLLGEIVRAPDSHPTGDFVILRETSRSVAFVEAGRGL